MTSKTAGRSDLNGSVYRQLRLIAIANCGGVCCLCGEFLDVTLSGRHRDGPTLEHLIPVSMGGDPRDPGNHGASHMRCNSSRQNRTIEQFRASIAKTPQPSRDW